MSSEDYLMRYFRQLGSVIASIFEYRKRKEFSLAIDEIDQVLNSWFNIDADKNDLDADYIEEMLKNPSQGYEAEKSLGELLYQKAMVYHEMGNTEDAAGVAELALMLVKTIDIASGEYSVESQQQISALTRLTQYE
jgi:hypothetical protein